MLADAIVAGLRRHAMAVDVAYDGGGALERAAVNDYDVVILDRDLPSVSGDVVCARLVQSGAATRILMLTAATAVVERVAGLRPRRRRLPDQTLLLRGAGCARTGPCSTLTSGDLAGAENELASGSTRIGARFRATTRQFH